MEPHFLAESVDGQPGFGDEPWYNPDGDCIVCQIANEAVVADRIDDVLTIYRSAIDDRPIGFQVKGICGLLRTFGATAFSIEAKREAGGLVSVSAVLLAAYEGGPRTVGRRRAYASIMGFPAVAHDLSIRELVPVS